MALLRSLHHHFTDRECDAVHFTDRECYADHGVTATASARVQLGYVLRRGVSSYIHHRYMCSRSQLQSKLDECKCVLVPMRSAMGLGTCGVSSAMARIQRSLLSSELFSAFAGNQFQSGSGSLFDNSNSWRGSKEKSPCTGFLLNSYIATYLAKFICNKQRLFYWGAKINSMISGGQVWRLLSSTFIHGNLLHLMVNYHSLKYVGPRAEMYYGTHQFLGVYIASALSGSVMSYLFEPRMSIGASGAIFGLIGASWVYIWRHWDVVYAAKENLHSLSLTIVLNLAVGLMLRRYIDNWAHVGGLLGGAAFSWHCPV